MEAAWSSIVMLDLHVQFEDRGFKSSSGHLLDLFLVVQSSNPSPHLYIIANWLPPASWVFDPVMLYLNYLFLSILSGVPVN